MAPVPGVDPRDLHETDEVFRKTAGVAWRAVREK
jgi:hypothetical protein